MSDVADLILQDLNPQQREAVTAPDGPLLVFAGAGSGKTRVLTRRIAYLLAVRDVSPSEIFAVTFTNKAAQVMRDRVEQLVGRHAQGMWIHTFHSACARLLRQHAELVGRKPTFSIYDDADQQTLLKELLKSADVPAEVLAPKQVAHLFDMAKNDVVDPAELASHVAPSLRDVYVRLCERYRQRMREANAFDFGDLIVETIRLLRENEAVREGVRQRFRHILVDEFQDTNRAQDLLLQELLGEHRNLMVVGDDDQSIYRWRGARIRNILDFEKRFDGAKVVVLGTNYRSTKRILKAADAVIRKNTGRKAKQLDTPNVDGDLVVRYGADDEYDEARWVARTISELRTRDGLAPGEIAVFYRTNAQSRLLEEKLLEWGIPYLIVGGTRFYDRKEIKDAMAYLRLLVNPADTVAFQRVVNVPARGIGARTLSRINNVIAEKKVDPLQACRLIKDGEGGLPAGLTQRVGDFVDMLDETAVYAQSHSPADIAGEVLHKSTYLQMLQESEKIEDKTRLENIGELLKSIEDFEKEAGDEATLALFLEKVSLLSDPDLYDDKANAVSLMTLHAAKGLEFDAVLMVGLEEGLLPHSRSMTSDEEYEEERRLCYVGITRARKKLHVSNSATRRSYGGMPMPTRKSPFWRDLPADIVEDYGRAQSQPLYGGDAMRPPTEPVEEPLPGEPVYDYSESQDPADHQRPLELMCRVHHPQFGYGTVINMAGSGKMARVTVSFATVGKKTLIVQYANLTYVSPPQR